MVPSIWTLSLPERFSARLALSLHCDFFYSVDSCIDMQTISLHSSSVSLLEILAVLSRYVSILERWPLTSQHCSSVRWHEETTRSCNTVSFPSTHTYFVLPWCPSMNTPPIEILKLLNHKSCTEWIAQSELHTVNWDVDTHLPCCGCEW